MIHTLLLVVGLVVHGTHPNVNRIAIALAIYMVGYRSLANPVNLSSVNQTLST